MTTVALRPLALPNEHGAWAMLFEPIALALVVVPSAAGALLAIAALERGEEAPNCFGTVRNPVRMMMLEHETVGEKLLEIRAVTGNFELPAEACTSYRVLFARLEELEQDLHRHIHLENNILFPRAIAAEESARGE